MRGLAGVIVLMLAACAASPAVEGNWQFRPMCYRADTCRGTVTQA